MHSGAELGEAADRRGRAAIQRDLPAQAGYTGREKSHKFSKGKNVVLLLRRNNPRHWYMLRANQLGRNFAERDLVVPEDSKLRTRQQ